jgi:hypothetical protein
MPRRGVRILGATLGTERPGVLTCSRALFYFLLLLFTSLSFFASSLWPRVRRQQATIQYSIFDTIRKRHTLSNQNPSCPYCLSLSSFPFFYISRLALLDITYPHKAAIMRQPYTHTPLYSILALPLCYIFSLFNPYSLLHVLTYVFSLFSRRPCLCCIVRCLALSLFSSLCPSFFSLIFPLSLL